MLPPGCRTLASGPPSINLLPAGQLSSVSVVQGTPAAWSLQPCTASAAAGSTCGAVASDYAGSDVTSSLTATDVTPCLAQQSCLGCDITFASNGLCAPGTYLYLYRSGLLPLYKCMMSSLSGQGGHLRICKKLVHTAHLRSTSMCVLCFAMSWCSFVLSLTLAACNLQS